MQPSDGHPSRDTLLCLNTRIQSYSEQDIRLLMNDLPAWRREQAQRFAHAGRQRECVLAYLELERALREAYGIREPQIFRYNAHGKPELESHPEIHFSLSHCRTAVGCLVSNRPCGLDIEHLRSIRPALVNHAMNDDEQEQIAADPRPEVAFLRLWTRKEALLKLRGTGLSEGVRDALCPPHTKGILLATEEHLDAGFVLSTALTMP